MARKSGRAALVLTQAQTATLKEAMAEFAAKSLALPLAVVSDGLNCFTVAQGIGAVHKRTITGGGKASVIVYPPSAVKDGARVKVRKV